MAKQKIFFSLWVLCSMVLFFVMGLWLYGSSAQAQYTCRQMRLISGTGSAPACSGGTPVSLGSANGQSTWRLRLCRGN